MKYAEKIGFPVYNQETFIKAMGIINPNIHILSEYINSVTPVEFLCECGEIHKKSPNSLLCGSRCRKFIGSNTHKPLKKDEFLKKLNNLNAGIEMLEDYNGANTKIKFKCSCGQEFYKSPSQIIHSNPLCPKCANNRVTATDAIKTIKKLSPNIQIDLCYSDKYIRKHDLVNCICKCGHTWKCMIGWLLDGHGCDVCNKKRLSSDEYNKRIKNIDCNITILSQYKTLEDNITYRCKCGNVHTKNARDLLRHPSCPRCADNTKKTTKEFIEEMKYINPQIIITGQYQNAETPIEYICDCGKIHKSSPSVLLQGHRCGHCNMSKPEHDFAQCLYENEIEYEYNYQLEGCINKNKLKFDFWLPKYNVLVEIDGEHHFRPVNFRGISDKKAKMRYEYCVEMDHIKDEFCLSNNLNLIRIPYWKFNKVYYQKIIDLIKKQNKV